MHTGPRLSVVALAVALVACEPLEDPRPTAMFETQTVVGQNETEQGRPRGVFVVTEEPARVTPSGTALFRGATIIYMNRDGGTIHHGSRSDSSANASTLAAATSTIEPWDVSDAGWAEVMSCVRAKFAPFAVEVTDIDPGETPHIESVVAGSPSDLGLAANIAGISPFTNNCSMIDRSMVFTFAELFGDDYQFVCDVVAQEVSHSIGLDHELLCEDPMSYLGCGPKSFQDVDAACGESSERPCACGAPTQNSWKMLTERLGPADNLNAPQLSLISPKSGDLVAAGFELEVEASDPDGIDEVRISVDGTPLVSLAAAPYTASIEGLALGRHWIDIEAFDASGARSHVAAAVEVTDAGELGCQSAGGAGGLPLPLSALYSIWLAARCRRFGRRTITSVDGSGRGARVAATSPVSDDPAATRATCRDDAGDALARAEQKA